MALLVINRATSQRRREGLNPGAFFLPKGWWQSPMGRAMDSTRSVTRRLRL